MSKGKKLPDEVRKKLLGNQKRTREDLGELDDVDLDKLAGGAVESSHTNNPPFLDADRIGRGPALTKK